MKLKLFANALPILCGIHCLATPVLASALPLTTDFVENPWVELAIMASGVVIGLPTLLKDMKHHGNKWFVAIWLLGMAGLLISTFALTEGTVPSILLMLVSVAAVGYALWRNYQETKCCAIAH